ncbi:FecR domain-containing protein [Rapidithrix thailandica]|uniref:FecR domain-containing protein n=1 Tax=Rapidithrix thailandica TaxID=413964 RepID=A0AAW9S7Q3_9BACT
MKYTDYTLEDFLQDEYFVQWVKKPGEEAEFFWQSWLANHPEKAKLLAQAKEIILRMEFPEKTVVQPSEEEITAVFNNILAQNYSGRQASKAPVHRRLNGQPSWNNWLKIAAVFLLPVFGVLLWRNYSQQNSNELQGAVEWVIKENPIGQKSEFKLPDGSKIHLNAASKLRFPKQFSDTLRLVYLEGEAFFEVEKEVDRPFIVQAKSLCTKVLGTSFNIRDYPEDGVKKIALLTGKVEVYNNANTGLESKEVLRPKEMLHYDSQKHAYTKHSFDPGKVLAWHYGRLFFEKESFDKVIPELERWYGVQIHCESPQILQGKFTGEFTNQSLEVVLKVMGGTSNFHFDITGKSVRIY